MHNPIYMKDVLWISLKRLVLAGFPPAVMLVLSCAGSGIQVKDDYPWGVDSAVVQIALDEGNQLFVASDRIEKGKNEKDRGIEYFIFFQKVDSIAGTPSPVQDESEFRLRIQRIGLNQKRQRKLLNTLTSHGIDTVLTLLQEEIQESLTSANRHFRASYEYNPFDDDLLVYLAKTHTLLGCLRDQESRKNGSHFSKASEYLSQALEMDRGGHDIYFNLAENYRAAEEWEKANHYYRLALNTLRDFDFLPQDVFSSTFDARVDSPLIFKYLYTIGDTYVKMYDAANAIRSFEEARPFAMTQDNRNRLDEYKRWVNWAEGNISAREKFELGIQFETKGDFLAASTHYMNVLEQVRHSARRAYWETSWRLSKVELEFLMDHSTYLAEHSFDEIGM